MLRTAGVSLLLSLISAPCFAASNEMAMLQESKPLVTRAGVWQSWGDHLHLKSGQEKLPLTFEVENGAEGRPKATGLKITLNRNPLADFNNFNSDDHFNIDLSGKLHAGNNSLQVQGFGPSGARLRWRLLIQRPVVISVTPDSISATDPITISGQHFCDQKDRIKVSIAGQYAKLVSSNTREISCRLPERPKAGKQALTVAVQNVSSIPVTVTIKTAPRITFIDTLSAPPLHNVTVQGDGFSPVANENIVMVGSRSARVLSATKSSITFTIPDMHFPTWHVPVRVTSNGMTSKEKIFIHLDMRVIPNEGHPIP
jgi:IPT/TIG domain